MNPNIMMKNMLTLCLHTCYSSVAHGPLLLQSKKGNTFFHIALQKMKQYQFLPACTTNTVEILTVEYIHSHRHVIRSLSIPWANRKSPTFSSPPTILASIPGYFHVNSLTFLPPQLGGPGQSGCWRTAGSKARLSPGCPTEERAGRCSGPLAALSLPLA